MGGGVITVLALWLCALPALAAPLEDRAPLPAAPAPAAPAPAAEATPLPPDAPIVVAVELSLPEGEDRAGLDELVELRPGAPLSRRAARRTIERLLATKRFADVVVRAFPVRGGVRVVIQLEPQPKVAALAVEGNRVLSREEVLDAARLKLGQDYYPEILRGAAAGVEAAYRQRGYDDAKVTAEPFEREGEASIVLRVDEGVPTHVGELTVAGSPGLPLARVLDEVGLHVGDVLDRRALDAGLDRLRALYRRERFYAARVGEPVVLPGGDGSRVALPLSAGPRYTLHFHGNRRFSEPVLLGALRYDGTETLDESTVNRLARRLERFYRYHGFYDARVTPQRILRPDEAEAVLAFVVEEGPLIRVERMEIVGNKEISTEELLREVVLQVANREPEEHGEVRLVRDPLELQGRSSAPPGLGADEPEPEPGSVFIEDAYLDAAEAMTAAYRQRGFPAAVVRYAGASVDVEGHTAQVRFEVREGTRAAVREVSLEGAPPGFDPRPSVGLAPGMPLSAGAAEQSRAALVQALGRAGYLFAQVTLETPTTPDGTKADVRFRVQAGPQVRMGRVLFQGLERTDDVEVVRPAVKLSPGAVLDPQGLVDTQRSLLALGIFRQVEVRLLEPERPEPVKDVVIIVKERARLVGEVSGGYSLADGPRLIGDVTLANLGGSGANLSGRAKVNYVGASALALSTGSLQGTKGIGYLGNVSVQKPGFLAEVGGRADLIAEHVIRQSASYQFDRYAAVLGLDWTARRWLNATLQGELQWVALQLLPAQRELEELITSVALQDQQRLRFPFGSFALATLRPAVALDLRDDPVNPRSGLLISATAEMTRDLYTQQTDATGTLLIDPVTHGPLELPIFALKLSGNVTYYLPITEQVILAVSGRVGSIVTLDPARPNTIAPMRFYLGGSNTLRGFREDGVIPEDSRERLDQEVLACKQLGNPAGCTASATVLARGNELPSEGGTLFVLGKAELRFPVASSFDLGAFAEAGNLWLSTADVDLTKLRTVAGVGLRYGTPIGPLALDVGFNLRPDEKLNEPLFNVNFSIGIF